jgi:hypothetical protein
VNDFIIKLKEKDLKVTVFTIYYRRDLEEYFIQMNSKLNNFFCFARLVYPFNIKTGSIISVYNYNFKFTICEDKKLKIDYEMENGQLMMK